MGVGLCDVFFFDELGFERAVDVHLRLDHFVFHLEGGGGGIEGEWKGRLRGWIVGGLIEKGWGGLKVGLRGRVKMC